MRKVDYLTALLSVFIPFCPLYAQAPQDFNADGISEVVTVESSGSDLAWKAVSLEDSSDIAPTPPTFGLATDNAVLAHWLGEGSPLLAVLRVISRTGVLNWRVRAQDGGILAKDFGKAGDIALSGGDFNGDGASDAAVIRFKGSRILWNVSLGLFTEEKPTKKRFYLGKNGDRVFFISPDGEKDYAAVIGRANSKYSYIKLRDVESGKVTTIKKFPRKLSRNSRPRPVALHQPEGGDLFFVTFEDDSDTTFETYDLAGNRISSRILAGKGVAVAGEYDADAPGEEILFQSSGEDRIYNPVNNASSTVSISTGTIQGETTVVITSTTVAATTTTTTTTVTTTSSTTSTTGS